MMNDIAAAFAKSNQGWEFIKEKKKVRKQENKKILMRPRKKRTRARKRARKHANTSACLRGRVRVYFLVHFLFSFYKFPALANTTRKIKKEHINNYFRK